MTPGIGSGGSLRAAASQHVFERFRSRCGIPAIRVYVRAADPDLKSEKNTILAIEPSGIDVRAVPQ